MRLGGRVHHIVDRAPRDEKRSIVIGPCPIIQRRGPLEQEWTGPAHAQDTIQSIYEVAKKEGKVAFFSSNDMKPNQESAKRFAK